MKQLIYFLVAIALFSCKQNPESLNPESIYHVKSKWEKQDGSEIYLSHFKGKVVVTSMIFTACKTACPRLSMEMKNISKKIGDANSGDVHYVLISIDPETDTPEVMTNYLKKYQFDEKNWSFIRSNESDTRELANIMAVKYKEISPIEFSHSNIISVYGKDGTLAFQKEGLDENPEAIAKEVNKQLDL